MLPIKIHTYVIHLRDSIPKWKYDHEMTEYYGMEDLSPQSFKKLSEKFFNDSELALKY